ncbi:MAG TPA: hypothetical protein VGS97_27465 [Actinocrinis sp.]|uniref:hypothetical protein n=1 Tax=Actinocrinis sp. TaxID=1920516 RepID=UPI002DDD1A9C|nr:hypothetical protein [Actinocrinis sp.]HEV2347858.1 hypothetical protein [Actinocrinis sp.]
MRLPRHPHDQDDPARHADRLPDDETEADDEAEYRTGGEGDSGSGRGGYLFTALADAPPLTLLESIAARSTRFSLSVPPDRIPPGQIYLLGSPGSPSCEVVQVDDATSAPGQPRSIRRALFGTVVTAHPAGTAATPISVERVDDWSRWTG